MVVKTHNTCNNNLLTSTVVPNVHSEEKALILAICISHLVQNIKLKNDAFIQLICVTCMHVFIDIHFGWAQTS